MKNLNRLFLIAITLLIIISCSKDDDPIPVYTLSIVANPSEGGSVSPLSESYESGENVTLTAIPAINFEFKNWTGAVTGTDYSVSITMDSDKSVTAVFEKKDTDEDGVTDDIDQCPDTPSGITVDAVGCNAYEPDWHYECYPVYDWDGYYLMDDCYWEYY